jgi:Flp pilus assembly protein TadB
VDARDRARRERDVIALLALACGGIAALPFVHLARREVVLSKVRPYTPERAPRRSLTNRFRRGLRASPLLASFARVARVPGVRRGERRRADRLQRELPVVVDLIGVAVAAGCTPFHAVEHATRFGPDATATALGAVIRGCARGRSFDDAMRDLGAAAPTFAPLADALRTSARLGTPAAPALARLATEVRADVPRRAEARARTVPVRLCFPLVLCVLPAFALLTVVPAVLSGFHP